MSEPILSPIFGVVIVLAGLALAVLVGAVLYKDEKKAEKPEPVYRKEPFKMQEESQVP